VKDKFVPTFITSCTKCNKYTPHRCGRTSKCWDKGMHHHGCCPFFDVNTRKELTEWLIECEKEVINLKCQLDNQNSSNNVA
jgi:hypothetical protein